VAAPLYIRLAITAFRQIEDEHLLAAQLDGATPVDAAWKVALPLARGALASGAAMAWARAVGEFGATLIFAGNFPGRTQTMPLAIYLGFEMDLDLALALSVVLLAVSVVVLVAVRVFGGGRA
jgi:molybdate transport system permease protein